MITPIDFLRLVISRWEGGYQSYADDQGNWVTKLDGTRVDVGTMRGVTPLALAQHLRVPAYTITTDRMKAVTLDEAAAIGEAHYYSEPGFWRFRWGPAVASLVDFGWMSGPGQAVLSIQRLVGVKADGGIGPVTAEAFNAWLADKGDDVATVLIHDMRASFYRHLAEVNPAYEQFLPGWLNRDDWASAANAEFARQWGNA